MSEFRDTPPEGLDDEVPSLQVITILLSDDDVPQVDLGDVSPWVAVSMLNKTAEAIAMTLRFPRVSYDGEVIFEELQIDAELDEEEEDL